MFYHFVSFLFCLLSCMANLDALLDLEEYPQDFVLDLKKIDIPDYPHAFNPSIVEWKGQLFMSFRIVGKVKKKPEIPSSSESYIGMVQLDSEFNVVGDPQLLDWNEDNDDIFPEDGRLLVKNEQLYLIYSGYTKDLLGPKGFSMYVAELDFDGSNYQIVHNECLSNFQNRNKNHREKNWVPFIDGGKLHLAYQLKPHLILSPTLDNSGICETISSTVPSFIWEWGELRGGTPALRLDESQYLAFFHSSMMLSTVHSEGKQVRHYFMGAYTFSTSTPYKIQRISPEPIVAKNFYRGPIYEPYWNPVRVVFPCGFIMDKNTIWVSYGRQDHECWVVKLDKKRLLDSLIHVSTYR